MTGEDGVTRTLIKKLDPSISEVDKTLLETAIAAAEKILTETPDGGSYTSENWKAFKNAYDPSVTWKSEEPAVATVSYDGTVTAHKAGTTRIAVTTGDGQKTAVCTVTVQAKHEVSEQWSHDATSHWHTCTCGEPHDKAPHFGGSATCTQRAVCEVCGQPYGELAGHTMEHHNAVPATCTAEGKAEYWHCTVCGKDYADAAGTQELTERIIPAKGHALTEVPAKDATEKEAGNLAYYVCQTCGKYYADAQGRQEISRESVVIPKLVPETKEPESHDDKPAQTGDRFQPELIGVVAVLALAGIVVVLVIKKKKNG